MFTYPQVESLMPTRLSPSNVTETLSGSNSRVEFDFGNIKGHVGHFMEKVFGLNSTIDSFHILQ